MKTTKRTALQLEALEARDVLSASPLPVLMVLPNQDGQQTQNLTTVAPAAQLDTYYGRGVLKSTDAGSTWTLNQQAANQLAGALQQSFAPVSPLAPVGGNETLTIGINHAQSGDYIQWRSRFGAGL